MKRGRLLLALFAATGCRSRDAPPPAAGARSTFDLLLARGEQIYRREEYDSARAFLAPLARQARRAGDAAAEARALTWLGLADWRVSDYSRAREALARSLVLKLALGLDRELWRSYNGLGLVAWNEGRHADALEHFAAAMAAARRVADTVAIGSTASNVALVRTELGDFAAAREGFLEARRIGRATGNARVEGNALTNLGMLDVRIGDPGDAIQHLDEARRLYRTLDYATGEQNALGQLGTAYAALGEPAKALQAFDSALSIARELDLPQEQASHLEAMGEQYRIAGDYRRALGLYEQARTLNASLGARVELGADLRSEAEIHVQLGDLARAARFARDALVTHQSVAARVEELADELLLADIADRAELRGEAETHLAAAAGRARTIGTRIARVSLALAAARIADRRDEPGRVLAILAGAGSDIAAGGYDIEWESHALHARALTRLNRLEPAVVEGRLAVAAIERVRGAYASGLLRTSYIADRSAVYGELAAVLLRLGRPGEAFEVSDAARGRALLERSVPGVGALQPVERRTALLAEIGGLVTQVAEFTRQYDATQRAVRANLDAMYGRLARDRSEFERLVASSPDAADGGAALLGVVPTRVSAVQASLQPGETLLEYLMSSDGVIGFSVTRERVEAFRCPITAANLEGKLRLARGLLARPGGRAGASVLEALYDALIAPARLGPEARRLVIVPHGVLMYLPFAALRDRQSNRYLVETASIIVLPSAGALPALRRRVRRAPTRAVAFAPFPEALPSSAAEARVLERAVRADVRLGARATEGSVREALVAGASVHAATHAALNAGNPLFSMIAFAPNPRAAAGDDGRLEVHEILGLTIASPLVFLSGCETALGPAGTTQFARGEDFATLAQAFLYGGAGNVVATLWRIDDAGAAVLAERFYRQLSTASPAEALASAQRDLLGDPHYRDPFYWAGYVLSGDGGSGSQETGAVSVRQ